MPKVRRYIADFDSSTSMLYALARCLHGKGFGGIGVFPAAAAGLDDEKVAQLSQWPSSPLFSAAERAALGFAEIYVIDPGAVTDAQCASVTEHFTPSEVAVLTTAIAVFDAMARFQVALAV